MAKRSGMRSTKLVSTYVPARAYRSSRVGTIPSGRKATDNGSHEGEYRLPPNGPGPGAAWQQGGSYPWKEPPPLDAVDFSGGGWVPCHPTSHLESIRFVHGLDSNILTLEQRQQYAYSLEEGKVFEAPDMSFLQVKFKKNGAWAVYWSVPGDGTYTAERLETIYLQLESDESPGEILWLSLIGKGGSVAWPYTTSASF